MQDYEEARSFPGTVPPEDAKEIDRKVHPVLGVVIYFKAPVSGTIYYATKRDLKFAAKMEKAIQRQKTKNNTKAEGTALVSLPDVIDKKSNGKLSISQSGKNCKKNVGQKCLFETLLNILELETRR